MKIAEWVEKRVRLLDAGEKKTVVVFTKLPGAFEYPGTLTASGIFFSGDGMVGFAVEANNPVAVENDLRSVVASLILSYIQENPVQ